MVAVSVTIKVSNVVVLATSIPPSKNTLCKKVLTSATYKPPLTLTFLFTVRLLSIVVDPWSVRFVRVTSPLTCSLATDSPPAIKTLPSNVESS